MTMMDLKHSMQTHSFPFHTLRFILKSEQNKTYVLCYAVTITQKTTELFKFL
jgi:hypothetical protein